MGDVFCRRAARFGALRRHVRFVRPGAGLSARRLGHGTRSAGRLRFGPCVHVLFRRRGCGLRRLASSGRSPSLDQRPRSPRFRGGEFARRARTFGGWIPSPSGAVRIARPLFVALYVRGSAARDAHAKRVSRRRDQRLDAVRPGVRLPGVGGQFRRPAARRNDDAVFRAGNITDPGPDRLRRASCGWIHSSNLPRSCLVRRFNRRPIHCPRCRSRTLRQRIRRTLMSLLSQSVSGLNRNLARRRDRPCPIARCAISTLGCESALERDQERETEF